MQQPNIIFIITDQQRFDHLGCNGHPAIKTPNLDRLARTGISLPRHYCNHPLCTPSRVSILTGRYPRSHRVYDNGGCLPTSELTMPQVLKMHGYGTHAIGKLHFSSWREPNAVSFESESFCWKIIYWGGQTYGELYDLVNDPRECRNLWDDPAHAGTRASLLAQLLDELVVTENILPLPLSPT